MLLPFRNANAQASCPANFSLCYSKVPFALTAGTPTGGTYSGTGVSAGSFNPSIAGIGIHTITYTAPDASTCTFKITVYQAGNISCVMEWPEVCTGMTPGNYGYCSVSPGFTSTYTGPGFVDNVFYPALAGIGFHDYQISATNANGCLVELVNHIEVYEGAPPVIDIDDITVPSTSTPPFHLTGGVDISHYWGTGVSGDLAMGQGYIFSPAVAGNGAFTIHVSSVYPEDDWVQKACYSEGTFEIQVGAMPVTLMDFSAKAVENDVLLSWRTAMEKDFDRFEIEKSSDPKTGFSKIHELKGGSLDGRYHFRDLKAEPGVPGYYRLKMIDTDGTFAFSKIAWVLPESNGELKVYPNPVKGMLTVDSPVNIREMILVNSSGTSVLSKKVNAKMQDIELPSLPAGVYLLELKRDNAASLFSKVVVR
jgi:hypothetical protein